MEYYSTVKRNEALICTTTWTNFDNLMLSARSHTKGHIVCDSIYTQCPEQAQPEGRDADYWLPGEDEQ